jgi:hypothetical protein
MSVYTRTFTLVKTRLESIEDQYAHFLQYGGVADDKAEMILLGVRNKWLVSVGLYLADSSGLRVAEVELRVDWGRHGELVLVQPTIDLDLPGWNGTQSPEVKIAGRRFAQLAKEQDLPVRYWVRFAPSVVADPDRHKELCPQVGVSFQSGVPAWKSNPDERGDNLLDLAEAEIVIRRARESS